MKRGRGRPSWGKPVPVRLDALENEIARQLGDGIISEGVRLALRAAHINGIDVTLMAAKKFGQPVEAEPAEGMPGETAQAQGLAQDAEIKTEDAGALVAPEGVSNE